MLWWVVDGIMFELVLMCYLWCNMVCIFLQVGCGMVCLFCVIGQGGLICNLLMVEIFEQVCVGVVVLCDDFGDWLLNVVFMGMGGVVG